MPATVSSPPKRVNGSKRSPAKPHSFLPYDPVLASESDEKFDVFPQAAISPSQPGDIDSPGVLFSLLSRPPSQDYAATGTATWGQAQAHHLFTRAAFGLNVAEAQFFASLSKAQAIDALFQDIPLPDPPGEWVSEPFDHEAYRDLSPEERQAFMMLNRQRLNELRGWWFEQMMQAPLNLREKMTLFWANHFTSDIVSVQLAQLLYIRNDTLRRHALGNFRALLKAIYKDPAMLLYLDGVSNVRRNPNENFARELLELFTLGIGNYTEDDIKEAARAFTGWRIDLLALAPVFESRLFDPGTKTFLGRTGNFTAEDIIDIILEQEVAAEFICRKLFAHLVSREIDEEFVAALASTFRSSDYEIKPVLRAIFESDYFYGEQAVASLIKSPVELAASNVRMLSTGRINLRYLLLASEAMSQSLMNPPNVAGWPGQRDWISPTTYVTRNAFSETFVTGGQFRDPDFGNVPIEFDPMLFARSFGIATARELATAVVNHLLRYPPDEDTFEFLLSVLVGSAGEDDWSLEYPGVERLVSAFLIEIMRLPEYHLT